MRSMANAWGWGVRFFAGRWLQHAILLIGIGILVPMALRFAVAGDVAMTSPTGAPGGSVDGGPDEPMESVNTAFGNAFIHRSFTDVAKIAALDAMANSVWPSNPPAS